jgi:hypothetical protein
LMASGSLLFGKSPLLIVLVYVLTVVNTIFLP